MTKIEWIESIPSKDFKRCIESVKRAHPRHEFEFALIKYKRDHLEVTRCVNCQKVVGALPIPKWEYQLIESCMKAFWEIYFCYGQVEPH